MAIVSSSFQGYRSWRKWAEPAAGVCAEIPRDCGAILARRFAGTMDAGTLSPPLAVTGWNRSDSFTAEGALPSQLTRPGQWRPRPRCVPWRGTELSV